ncbi:MAG: hypothetical protein H0Z28_13860 [Archaeoglobus sp.]|nr:hypothetical protein [Archaeoglobus sp.]
MKLDIRIKVNRKKLDEMHKAIKKREKIIHFVESPEQKYFYQPISYETRYYQPK